MTTYDHTYGIIEVGNPERGEGNTWARRDTYRPKDGQGDELVFTHCAGPQDSSDHALTYNGNTEYRIGCGCCYFGFSHTLDLHNGH